MRIQNRPGTLSCHDNQKSLIYEPFSRDYVLDYIIYKGP